MRAPPRATRRSRAIANVILALLLIVVFVPPLPSRASRGSGPPVQQVPLALRSDRRGGRERAGVCVDRAFTALALRWRQSGAGKVGARVATAAVPGRWSAFDELHVDPDAARARRRNGLRTSGLLWTGEARCARVALKVPDGTRVSEASLVLIDSSGTTPGVLRAPGSARAVRPWIVTRREWRANESLRNCQPYYARRIKAGFVHHTAGSNSYSRSESDDVVRAVYVYHTRVRGWCDVGYNFLVDRFGRVYEGRKGGITLPVVPAAQQGFNRGAFAVSVMGNFESRRVPRAAVKSLKRLLAWRLDVAHLPADGWATMVSTGGPNTRYPAGTKVHLRVLNGHRRTGYTACPGDRLARLLPRLRAAAARIGAPKILRPRARPSAFVPGSERAVLRARASQSLEWSITIARRGEVIASFTDRGRRLRHRWKGTDDTGEPLPAGRYVVTFAGTAAGGAEARPALVGLRLRAK